MVKRYSELPEVFIHPQALVESDRIGEGTRIWAFAHVLEGATVGTGCNLCDGVFVEGGARLGDRVTVKNNVLIWDQVTVENEVFLGPNMLFTNDLRPRVALKKGPEAFIPTLVKRGASLGAGVTVVCGITIGRHAFVGAGAVVHRDVPDHALVLGNPARQHGWVCACAQRLPRSETDGEVVICRHCGTSLRCTESGVEVIKLGPDFS